MKKFIFFAVAVMLIVASLADANDVKTKMFKTNATLSGKVMEKDGTFFRTLVANLNSQPKKGDYSLLGQTVTMDSLAGTLHMMDDVYPDNLSHYIYNEENQVIRVNEYMFDLGLGERRIFSIMDFEFDSQSRINKMILSNYIEDYGEVIMTAYFDFEYDNNDNPVKVAGFLVTEMGFMEWMIMESDFNQNGDITEERYYLNEGEGIQLNELSEYNYDNNGFIKSIDAYRVDDWDNELYLEERMEYVCDENGYVIKETISIYYGEDDWELEEEKEFQYDQNGNPTLEVFYSWFAGEMFFDQSVEYSYDLSVNYDDISALPRMFLEPQFSEHITNKPTEILYIYDPEDESYYTKGVYYYSDSETSVTEKEANSLFSIYPNPTKDYINIESDATIIQSIDIFDISGRVVLGVNSVNQSASVLNISQLPAGSYLLKVNFDNNTKSQVFIKE